MKYQATGQFFRMTQALLSVQPELTWQRAMGLTQEFFGKVQYQSDSRLSATKAIIGILLGDPERAIKQEPLVFESPWIGDAYHDFCAVLPYMDHLDVDPEVLFDEVLLLQSLDESTGNLVGFAQFALQNRIGSLMEAYNKYYSATLS